MKNNEKIPEVAPTLYAEDIENHFEKLFGVKEKEHTVFHEIISDTVHLDVHVIAPSEERPFKLLFTTGMSDLPMTLPEDMPEEYRETCERAELYCVLPPNWKLDNNMTEEEQDEFYWVIAAMKEAARYPHLCGTWLGHCHTLQYDTDNAPFSPCTELCAAVFYQLDHTDFGGKYGDGLAGLNAEDGTYISLLCFVPIYEEEMQFKLDTGASELYKKLFGEDIDDITQLMIDNKRKNICK